MADQWLARLSGCGPGVAGEGDVGRIHVQEDEEEEEEWEDEEEEDEEDLEDEDVDEWDDDDEEWDVREAPVVTGRTDGRRGGRDETPHSHSQSAAHPRCQ